MTSQKVEDYTVVLPSEIIKNAEYFIKDNSNNIITSAGFFDKKSIDDNIEYYDFKTNMDEMTDTNKKNAFTASNLPTFYKLKTGFFSSFFKGGKGKNSKSKRKSKQHKKRQPTKKRGKK